MKSGRLGIAVAWVLLGAIQVPACGRETIELARDRQDQGGDGGPGDGGKECVEDCHALNGACNEQTGSCGECNTKDDCAGKQPLFLDLGIKARDVCDTVKHECVACTQDSDCDSITLSIPGRTSVSWRCDTRVSRCTVACSAPSDCSVPDSPVVLPFTCDQERAICVECTSDINCMWRLVFDPLANSCVRGRCIQCIEDSECGSGLHCHAGTGRCVQCRDTGDCPAGSRCDASYHFCSAM